MFSAMVHSALPDMMIHLDSNLHQYFKFLKNMNHKILPSSKRETIHYIFI